ncbi:MAG: GerMN domain-containing protein [Christensenellaceae bacterium]|nr:GerMN domain-containing protein [Christensenellaceae bacterium]
MSKRILTVILAVVLIISFTGCSSHSSAPDNTFDDIEINPDADAAKTETISATLYYADSSLRFLVDESRKIETPVNDRIEVFILQELIKGPSSSNSSFNSLINPNTKIVSVSDSGDVLTIVLSNEFLSWPFDTEASNSDTLKMLSVYSIVNTLVESSGYPRIQILVDRNSSGAGQRLRIHELGSSGYFSSGEAGILGPLSRNGSIVLSPVNALNEILKSMTTKDLSSLYLRIAYSDTYGHKRPDETAFLSYAQASPTIEGYSIGDVIVSDDGQSAVIMIDYTLRLTNEQSLTRTNVPTTVYKENGVWKQKYSDFQKLFDVAEEIG